MVITLNQKQPIYIDVIQLTAALVKYVCRFNEPHVPRLLPMFHVLSPFSTWGGASVWRLALGWVLI